jgi:hypothetical protein
MAKKPPLALVPDRPPTAGPLPPRNLGVHGRSLWDRIQREYDVTDCGGIEMLALAAQALDRAESCREQIDRDGEMIRTKGGARENPLLKSELASRAFVVRTLARLGLNFEPVRPAVGRPGGGGGGVLGHDD